MNSRTGRWWPALPSNALWSAMSFQGEDRFCHASPDHTACQGISEGGSPRNETGRGALVDNLVFSRMRFLRRSSPDSCELEGRSRAQRGGGSPRKRGPPSKSVRGNTDDVSANGTNHTLESLDCQEDVAEDSQMEAPSVRPSRQEGARESSNCRGPSGSLGKSKQIVPSGSLAKLSVSQASCVQAALPFLTESVRDLCCFCFAVLERHLLGKPPPSFPATSDPLFTAPLFVTWLKRRSGRGNPDLRGCIGCLDCVTFNPGLSEYALRSSTRDRRFPPVELQELPALICRLSILFNFEPCAHIYDWEVGVHGVLINFDMDSKHYSATYLPEVARETGMTQEVAIRELVAKAGFRGDCNDGLLSRVHATRYQTTVTQVAYKDFSSKSRASLQVDMDQL